MSRAVGPGRGPGWRIAVRHRSPRTTDGPAGRLQRLDGIPSPRARLGFVAPGTALPAADREVRRRGKAAPGGAAGQAMSGSPSIIGELKRRNVIRMAGLYLVGA